MGLMVKELVLKASVSLKRELRWGLRRKSNNISNHHNQQKVIGRPMIFMNNAGAAASDVVEVIGQQGGSVSWHAAEDGSVKMKILIKKQDLDRILLEAAAMNKHRQNYDGSTSDTHHIHHMLPSTPAAVPSITSSTSPVESRLYGLMRRKRRASQTSKGSRSRPTSHWRPALHTIPE